MFGTRKYSGEGFSTSRRDSQTTEFKPHMANRKYERHKSKRLKQDENPLPGTSRATKSKLRTEKIFNVPVYILDNGGYSAKVGLSTKDTANVVPNCIMKVKSERKRFFIGNQIDECLDLSGLYYLLPCEKGYVTKWNVQKPVWDYIFNNVCPIEENPVIMTQPPFNFKAIQEITDEIFFEEYEVKAIYRANPTDFAYYQYNCNAKGDKVPCIIIDTGFSFTHVIPYIDGKKYYKAAKRIDIGGKLLTNYLKDIISYRQLHVMDETYIINQVKEDSCYVSLDFKEDMKIAGLQGESNTIIRNYVLPDFNNIRRGYVQKPEDSSVPEGCQILRLNNERFTVPELLFHPSDIGMDTMGIAEAVVKCIFNCPEKYQSQLAQNIIVMGGNASFEGFGERLYKEVRSYLPDHWKVNVYKPENPITYAWLGAKSMSEDPKIKSLLVTKEQYEEHGPHFTYERFSDWLQAKKEDLDSSPMVEVKPTTESVLLKANFSRKDLFGKYDPDLEENSNNEQKSEILDTGFSVFTNPNESKNITDDTSRSSKSSDIISEGASQSVSSDSANKNLDSEVFICNTDENSSCTNAYPSGLNMLDTYDFDIFNQGFV
ncbi:actin-related protein 6 [Agrilus planipennis]|uniref:Actin-related protein 6 n=1 Tax=Agrilus planipennis TaxID=224129 RepID=A0A1W4WVB1_AGRPL|nr:actin-related protein 6 [Agrilus planipennis]XP_018327821.1 actin-related protein 6 [Agrilus planipennis]